MLSSQHGYCLPGRHCPGRRAGTLDHQALVAERDNREIEGPLQGSGSAAIVISRRPSCPSVTARSTFVQVGGTIEVTFEESRAHLGAETQRQWSDPAIARSTACLFGLYSLVGLLGSALHPAGDIPFQPTAWYRKQQATFGDVLATVRRQLWSNLSHATSA
jgi:hypothetical protein